MSLQDAQRMLRWNVVTEALTAAGVDAETLDMVERARDAGELMQGMARMLIGGSDTKQAKNYVKFEMVGLVAPFERVYVELIREGGKTSHELRELLRDQLELVRRLLVEGPLLGAPWAGVIGSIDEVLEAEKPR